MFARDRTVKTKAGVGASLALMGLLALGVEESAAQCPTDASTSGLFATPGWAWGMDRAGDLLYVADWQEGLQIVDVTDPLAPVLRGRAGTGSLAWRVEVVGDFAYVASGTAGLVIVDVSDPDSPVIVGTADTSDEAHGVAISGTIALVADHETGLVAVDVSDPASPVLLDTVGLGPVARDVAVSGGHAYVAANGGGLRVVDISDPTDLVHVGALELPDGSWDVLVQGTRAYVGAAQGGFQIVDISDPTAPVLIGSLDTPGVAVGIDVIGDCAFVADYSGGLRIIDISDPAAPTPIDALGVSDRARDVIVGPQYAYVSDQSAGLRVISWGDLIPSLTLCPIGGEVNVQAGQVAVPIVLTGTTDPLGAFGLDFQFDDTYLSYHSTLPSGYSSGFSNFAATEISGGIRIGAFHSEPLAPADPDTLVYVVLDIDPAATGTASLLTTNVEEIPAPDCSGTITFVSCLADGDVDANERLNPNDAFCAFQCFLNGGAMPEACLFESGCEETAADVDCSGACTSRDALWIFERYLCDGDPAACGGDGPACSVEIDSPDVAWLKITATLGQGPALVRVPVDVRGEGTVRAFGLSLLPLGDLDVVDFERSDGTVGWAAHGFAVTDSLVRLGGFDPAGIELTDGEWTPLGETRGQGARGSSDPDRVRPLGVHR